MYIRLKDIMIRAAEEAGAILRDYFSTQDFRITQKSMNADLVTEVDKKVQDIVIGVLSGEFPDIPIVAEEKENKKEATAFYVDPLDGTLNFAHGFPVFSVSIGYWENNEPKVGVVYNPISHEMYWAVDGEGAYLNNMKISVSSTSSLKNALLATGWPYNRESIALVVEYVKNALNSAQEVRSLGSAALECCYVARGALDGYWEWGLCPWDLAAGVVILKEAGATVTGIEGDEFSLDRGDIVCANPHIHEELLSMLKSGDSR